MGWDADEECHACDRRSRANCRARSVPRNVQRWDLGTSPAQGTRGSCRESGFGCAAAVPAPPRSSGQRLSAQDRVRWSGSRASRGRASTGLPGGRLFHTWYAWSQRPQENASSVDLMEGQTASFIGGFGCHGRASPDNNPTTHGLPWKLLHLARGTIPGTRARPDGALLAAGGSQIECCKACYRGSITGRSSTGATMPCCVRLSPAGPADRSRAARRRKRLSGG